MSSNPIESEQTPEAADQEVNRREKFRDAIDEYFVLLVVLAVTGCFGGAIVQRFAVGIAILAVLLIYRVVDSRTDFMNRLSNKTAEVGFNALVLSLPPFAVGAFFIGDESVPAAVFGGLIALTLMILGARWIREFYRLPE